MFRRAPATLFKYSTPLFFLFTAFNNSLFTKSAQSNFKKVKSVSVEGLSLVSQPAVVNVLPYTPGGDFDASLSSDALHSINNLGYFESADILTRESESDVDIKVVLKEKAILTGYEFFGNQQITSKKLSEKIELRKKRMVSEHEIDQLRAAIASEYKKINYFDVAIKITPEFSEDSPKKVFLRIDIIEGVKTKLSKVNFVGCEKVTHWVFKNSINTREDWLFGWANGAGKLDLEKVEQDKRIIERKYQDRGFYKARVDAAEVENRAADKDVQVTFHVDEGEQYKLRFITVPTGPEAEFSEEDQMRMLLIKRNDLYNVTKLVDSMDRLKNLYGNKGYVFCDVYPDIKEVVINGQKYLDVDFKIEKGEKYTINRIIISGNKNTLDEVVRRELFVYEGGLANRLLMEASKDSVEALGYFDKNLDWKVTKVGEGKVDLELNVKEIRTGNGSFGITGGPDRGGSSVALRLVSDFQKRNFAGYGWDVGAGLTFGSGFVQKAHLDFCNPSLFNKNIYWSSNAYLENIEYRELGGMMNLSTTPMEQTVGVGSRFGFSLFPHDSKIRTIVDLGAEVLSFSNFTLPSDLPTPLNTCLKDLSAGQKLQHLLSNSRLKDGAYNWIGFGFEKNKLNHHMYPYKGWKAELLTKLALPVSNSSYSMMKTEFNASYFIPLIHNERLVFSSSFKVGFVAQISDTLPVPMKELYSVGGSSSLRGFRWGEAGPMVKSTLSPLGAKNFMLMRFELISPLTTNKDITMSDPRGYLFYDIGSGWNAPKQYVTDFTSKNKMPLFSSSEILNDRFRLRHTVGFGLRLTVPQPIKLEFGMKLDRIRANKERPSEWHFQMNVPIA